MNQEVERLIPLRVGAAITQLKRNDYEWNTIRYDALFIPHWIYIVIVTILSRKNKIYTLKENKEKIFI